MFWTKIVGLFRWKWVSRLWDISKGRDDSENIHVMREFDKTTTIESYKSKHIEMKKKGGTDYKELIESVKHNKIAAFKKIGDCEITRRYEPGDDIDKDDLINVATGQKDKSNCS